MLTELIKLGHKMKKQMKDTQNEIKQNIQWQEGNQDSKQRFGTKGKNKHPTETEWIIQKSEERLKNLWDILKCSNIWITEVPEGE